MLICNLSQYHPLYVKSQILNANFHYDTRGLSMAGQYLYRLHTHMPVRIILSFPIIYLLVKPFHNSGAKDSSQKGPIEHSPENDIFRQSIEQVFFVTTRWKGRPKLNECRQ
jgi:hypothetical protein